MAKKVSKKKSKQKPVKKASKKSKPETQSQKLTNKIKTTPMPTAGKKIAGFESRLDEIIAEEPKPQHGGKRPGAGRPKKPPEPQTSRIYPSEIEGAVIEFLRIPFDLWAAKTGIDDLTLTAVEAHMLSKPIMILLEYYAPNLGEIAIAWASLAVVTAAIMRPRFIILKKIRTQYIQERTSAAQPVGATPTGPAPLTPKPAGNMGPTGFPTVEGVETRKGI
ncbi:MAG: hypothetical protein DRP65_04195 [Planctomycetota bacterium]|nr:MAG: hypothetical protein DRP65_04195 [Planctomycetota bacterium]